MGSGKITELFGMLPEWASAGVSPQEIMNIVKGDAEEPDVGDLGYDIAMEGMGMSFFDQILAETGNVPVAIGAAKVQAMQDILAGEQAEKVDIERIKIDEAAKAAIEAPDIATQLLSEAPPNLMDESIIRLRLLEDAPVTDHAANFANQYGVNPTDVVKAINLQLEEIESENAEWAFDPGQMQMQMGLTAPDPWASADAAFLPKGGQPGEGQDLLMEQLALEASAGDAAADQAQSVANVQYNALLNSLAALPPSDAELEARKEEKAARKLLWDKLPQILGSNQAQILSGYENPEDAISDLLVALQDQFLDYSNYPGSSMDYYKNMIGAILNSEVAKGTEWEGTTADNVISQWASASPDVMALRSEGNIDYLLSSNTDIKAWFDQAVEQGFSPPMIATGKKFGIMGSSQQAEADWWTNLSPTVQVYLMDAVNKAREGVTTVDPADVPAAFEITPLMRDWITNTVAFIMKVPDYSDPGTIAEQDWAKDLDQKALEAIQAEVQSQIVAAQQAGDPTSAATTAVATATVATGAPTQTTLDQIIQLGNTMTTAPDVSLGGYEFIGMPSTTGWGTVNLWYDPEGKHVYGELADGTWRDLGASTLSQLADNQLTLEIGPEGSAYIFTAWGNVDTHIWQPLDQTGADDTSTSLSAMLGIPATDVASTFRGRPGALWEAARTAQLGPKAHIPQYWKTRMQGFTSAWGRHMMGSSPNESFAAYLGRTTDQDPNQTAEDWGLAVEASRALGTPNSYLSVGATNIDRIRAHQMQGLLRKGKAEVLAMASAGLGIDPDTYGGNAAYTRLSNMYDIFEQQEAGTAGDPGKFLSWIDDLMSGQATTTTSEESIPTSLATGSSNASLGDDATLTSTGFGSTLPPN
jgi:hypothetical protein